MNIDWTSDESHVFYNPKSTEKIDVKQLQQEIKSHLWIATSGTSGKKKWTALSKKAILHSAEAVNKHLESSHSDIWIHPLPDYHVGGIGIWARAYSSKSKVIDYKAFHPKWNPQWFCDLAEKSKATLASLVPTQVYDLIIGKCKAPSSLRAVIVGGGKLQDIYYTQAQALGWKLLPSYGLTECASQVATASFSDPQLTILSHCLVKINQEGNIMIKSDSLFTGYAIETSSGFQFFDPKQEGWFTTEDRGKIEKEFLQIFGRGSHFVKVSGESVDLNRLQDILESLKQRKQFFSDLVITALPDPRLGHSIYLVGNEHTSASIIEEFNKLVLPFERIRSFVQVPQIPRNEMGKVNQQLLGTMLAKEETSR